MNNTKIYSDGNLGFGTGTPVDGVERFWRNLIAGCASCRFHRPIAGIGLNRISKACIAAARKAESVVRFWDVQPRMDLLGERDKDEAYLAAKPGEKYLLYFTDGGSVTLDLRGASGTFRLRWINISTGQWGGKSTVKGGGRVTIKAPGRMGWIAAIAK
ncbi:MAG: putative collagen-binding domain-containing protein [Planctomycetaceae bacterium]